MPSALHEGEKALHLQKKLFQQMRPIQWSKNVFVFSGIIFSNSLSSLPHFLQALLVAISFCLVSSSIYILNDIIDRENDKHHPKKRFRPIASGEISLQTAALTAFFLATVGLSLVFWVSIKAFFIVAFYIFTNIAYSIKLKQIVIIDVFCISWGFMLRILAGTLGIGIPPSRWLILCGLMITLFLGFTKRRAELAAVDGDNLSQHRNVLRLYSKSFLDQIISICAACTIITYSLYTMSAQTVSSHQTENLIFTVPFVAYALFRYIFTLQTYNSAGDPSTDLIKDKHIVATVIAWVISSLFFINYTSVKFAYHKFFA